MKANLVTTKQAKELKALGFRDKVSRCMSVDTGSIYPCIPQDRNHFESWVSIPTVDEAIDFIRRKYDIVVYNTAAPFVDPTDKKRRISYSFSVKHCNRRDGWNGRTFIGYTDTSYNIYVVKRRAVALAIAWINKFLKK